MPIIYEPRGRAREYSELAVNLYTGCSHGCRYCYCPAILRKKVDDWMVNPKPRKNILKLLENDAMKLQGDTRDILFSFMSDPYHSDEASALTREALLIMEKYNLRVQVLTKAGTRSRRDFDILARNNWKYGATIIFSNDEQRKQWEPYAAPINERIDTIREAHRCGIYTWVSIEPVVDPSQALIIMYLLKGSVDLWKVGKLNHDRNLESAIDWQKFVSDTIQLLDGENVIIKKDLQKFIPHNDDKI